MNPAVFEVGAYCVIDELRAAEERLVATGARRQPIYFEAIIPTDAAVAANPILPYLEAVVRTHKNVPRTIAIRAAVSPALFNLGWITRAEVLRRLSVSRNGVFMQELSKIVLEGKRYGFNLQDRFGCTTFARFDDLGDVAVRLRKAAEGE